MSTSTGRPRPFLEGVYRTACNYCVRSKRGCSGGNPCEQCEKRGKTCTYAQRRMSGPRGRPSGHSHRVRSRARARRQKRAEELKNAAAVAAAVVPQQSESTPGTAPPRPLPPGRTVDGGDSSSEYTPSDGWDSDFDPPIMGPVTTPAVSTDSVSASTVVRPVQGEAVSSEAQAAARKVRRVSIAPAGACFTRVDGYDSDVDAASEAVVPDELAPRSVHGYVPVASVPRAVSAPVSTGELSSAFPKAQKFIVSPTLSSGKAPIISSPPSPREVMAPILSLRGASAGSSAQKMPRAVSCPQPLPPVPVPMPAMLVDAGVILPPTKRSRRVSVSCELSGHSAGASSQQAFPVAQNPAQGEEALLSPSLSGSSCDSFSSVSSSTSSAVSKAPSKASPSLVPYDEFESGVQQRQAALVDLRGGDSVDLHPLHAVRLTKQGSQTEPMIQALQAQITAPQTSSTVMPRASAQPVLSAQSSLPMAASKPVQAVQAATSTQPSQPSRLESSSQPLPIPQVHDILGVVDSLDHKNPAIVGDLGCGDDMWKESREMVGAVEDIPLDISYTSLASTVPTVSTIPETFPVNPCLTGTVSAGTDLWEEFVDLESMTMASAAPLTREASLLRAMEAVGTEIMMPQTNCEPSVFADLW